MEPNGRIFAKSATENLNKLLEKIHGNNQEEKKQIILLIDEVVVNFDNLDFTLLQLMYPFIHILIAVNPTGFFLTKALQIIPPSGSNVQTVRLMTKHRNSFQIALLLAHTNRFYRKVVITTRGYYFFRDPFAAGTN